MNREETLLRLAELNREIREITYNVMLSRKSTENVSADKVFLFSTLGDPRYN